MQQNARKTSVLWVRRFGSTATLMFISVNTVVFLVGSMFRDITYVRKILAESSWARNFRILALKQHSRPEQILIIFVITCFVVLKGNKLDNFFEGEPLLNLLRQTIRFIRYTSATFFWHSINSA